MRTTVQTMRNPGPRTRLPSSFCWSIPSYDFGIRMCGRFLGLVTHRFNYSFVSDDQAGKQVPIWAKERVPHNTQNHCTNEHHGASYRCLIVQLCRWRSFSNSEDNATKDAR